MNCSVVFCCFNSAARIEQALKACAAALVDRTAEIVLVDNASTDGTAVVAARVAAELGLGDFRVVVEEKKGLMFARIAGILATRGRYVAFLDDDNWALPGYFEAVASAFEHDEAVAVFGCATRLPDQHRPPLWWQDFQSGYAVGRLPYERGTIPVGSRVWGAGLAFRASVIKRILESGFKPVLVGRAGAVQLAGDDSELVLAVSIAGYKVWYDNREFVVHAIDESRMTEEVLLRTHEGFGRSDYFVQSYVRAARGKAISPMLDLPIFLKGLATLARECAGIALARRPAGLHLRVRLRFFMGKWRQYMVSASKRATLRRNVTLLRALSDQR